MWKWYKNGIKYIQSYDVDSLCLGCLFLGMLIAISFYDTVSTVSPIWFYVLGVGFLAAPIYKFTKRSKLAFPAEVVIKKVSAPAKKKATVKKATTKKAVAKKTVAKKAPAKKVAKKASKK